MPIAVTCPGCRAGLNAPDAAAGKRVKCPKCQAPITVPDPNGFEVIEDAPPTRPAVEATTPARPVRSPVPDDEDAPPPRRRVRVEEEDEDEDDRPRSRRRAVVEDEDEDDDRPRRRRRDDDEEDEDDRPVRGKGKGKKKSKLPLILLGTGLGGVLLVGGVLALGYYLTSETQELAKKGGLGLNGGQPVSADAGWVKFEGPDVPFVASFPGGAPEKTDPLAEIPDPEQKKMVAALGSFDMWVRADGDRKYVVSAFQMPDAPPANQVNLRLDAAMQGASAMTKATPLGRPTSGDWKGSPYRQAALKLPSGQIQVIRIFLVKATLYQLIVEGDNQLTPTDKKVVQFHESFEPKPKDVPQPEPKKGITPKGSGNPPQPGRKRP